jgi:tetratricopeptide (TPR) repeat protein
MEIWPIAGNLIAGIAVLLFGREQGWPRRVKIMAGAFAACAMAGALATAHAETRPPAPQRAAKFAILVADLDGDADRVQTLHVLQSLQAQFAEAIGRGDLQVLSRGEALRLPSGDAGAAEIAAQKQGRAWLKEQNADVLIWGEVAQDHKLLRLRFLRPEDGAGPLAPYEPSPALELPPGSGADIGTIVAVTAIVYERSGKELTELISPIVAKLKPLAENPPASFSSELRAQLWHAYAVGEWRPGERESGTARLTIAIAFFRKSLTEWTRERAPLQWATVQNHIGAALMSLSWRESGTAPLEEAVTAYREALKERTRERMPLQWAATQDNLGDALESLSERGGGTARLDEAVTAYREALKEYTRERVPLQWAATQYNLGIALLSLGGRERSTVRLEEAAGAFREALKERTRERVPRQWATTQNNLGDALARLGERESGTAQLKEAAGAYREVLKEWTRERVPMQWVVTQYNLGEALRRLGERESGTAQLEEAVAAYREAQKEWTREGKAALWVMIQYNIGVALNKLGERESGTARLEEAVAANREAFEEYAREGPPLQQAAARYNLGIALAGLGERQAGADKAKGCAALASARENYAATLEEYRKAGLSQHVSEVEKNVAKLGTIVARLCG